MLVSQALKGASARLQALRLPAPELQDTGYDDLEEGGESGASGWRREKLRSRGAKGLGVGGAERDEAELLRGLYSSYDRMIGGRAVVAAAGADRLKEDRRPLEKGQESVETAKGEKKGKQEVGRKTVDRVVIGGQAFGEDQAVAADDENRTSGMRTGIRAETGIAKGRNKASMEKEGRKQKATDIASGKGTEDPGLMIADDLPCRLEARQDLGYSGSTRSDTSNHTLFAGIINPRERERLHKKPQQRTRECTADGPDGTTQGPLTISPESGRVGNGAGRGKEARRKAMEGRREARRAELARKWEERERRRWIDNERYHDKALGGVPCAQRKQDSDGNFSQKLGDFRAAAAAMARRGEGRKFSDTVLESGEAAESQERQDCKELLCSSIEEKGLSARENVQESQIQPDEKGQDVLRLGDRIDGIRSIAEDLPEGWTVHMDPDRGLVYYFHAATGVSQWDLPGVTGEEEEEVDGPSSVGDDWEQHMYKQLALRVQDHAKQQRTEHMSGEEPFKYGPGWSSASLPAIRLPADTHNERESAHGYELAEADKRADYCVQTRTKPGWAAGCGCKLTDSEDEAEAKLRDVEMVQLDTDDGVETAGKDMLVEMGEPNAHDGTMKSTDSLNGSRRDDSVVRVTRTDQYGLQPVDMGQLDGVLRHVGGSDVASEGCANRLETQLAMLAEV